MGLLYEDDEGGGVGREVLSSERSNKSGRWATYPAALAAAAVAELAMMVYVTQALPGPESVGGQVVWWLNSPTLWASRVTGIEAAWALTLTQLLLLSLPVYVVMLCVRGRSGGGGSAVEVPRLTDEQICEHVEGVGRHRAVARPKEF